MIRFAPIFVALALLVGCTWFDGAARAARRAAAATVATAPAAEPAVVRLPPPADTKAADDQIAHWQQVADRAEQDRDAAVREVVRLGKVRDALRLEAWRDRLAWTAGVMLLGVLAGVALEFILPTGLRGWATTAIVVCVAVAIAAWTLRAVLPWLPLVARITAWSTAVSTVGFALWRLRQAILAARHAADHGDRMEAALIGARDWFAGDETLLHQLVASVKVDSAKAQAAAGIGGVLARIRGADPAQSAAMAQVPVIRPLVAEIAGARLLDPQPHDLPATVAAPSALTPEPAAVSDRVDLAPLLGVSPAQAAALAVDVSTPPSSVPGPSA